MMPPTDPIEPPVGDVTPYPMDILILGGDRWLTQEGRVILEPRGIGVDLEPNTTRYWEEAALRGSGVSLYSLMDV